MDSKEIEIKVKIAEMFDKNKNNFIGFQRDMYKYIMSLQDNERSNVKALKQYVQTKNAFHWDQIQAIITQEEKGTVDINLNILHKIHNNCHNLCVNILKQIDALFGELK